MKVVELFQKVSDEDLVEALNREYAGDSKELNPDRMLKHRDQLVNDTISVKEDLVKVVVKINSYADGNGGDFVDSFGVDAKDEEYGLTTTPWGIVRDLEVEIQDDIDENVAAAAILYEITFFGGPEGQREMVADLHDRIQEISESDSVEIAPGIFASAQVLEAMKQNPDLAEWLEGQSFETMKDKGRKLKE